jgi:hypothetical protein
MKIARVKFIVKDDFETGDCCSCPLGSYISSTGNTVCVMNYRNCDCPIRLDDYSYAMDEEDITD